MPDQSLRGDLADCGEHIVVTVFHHGTRWSRTFDTRGEAIADCKRVGLMFPAEAVEEVEASELATECHYPFLALNPFDPGTLKEHGFDHLTLF